MSVVTSLNTHTHTHTHTLVLKVLKCRCILVRKGQTHFSTENVLLFFFYLHGSSFTHVHTHTHTIYICSMVFIYHPFIPPKVCVGALNKLSPQSLSFPPPVKSFLSLLCSPCKASARSDTHETNGKVQRQHSYCTEDLLEKRQKMIYGTRENIPPVFVLWKHRL